MMNRKKWKIDDEKRIRNLPAKCRDYRKNSVEVKTDGHEYVHVHVGDLFCSIILENYRFERISEVIHVLQMDR